MDPPPPPTHPPTHTHTHKLGWLSILLLKNALFRWRGLYKPCGMLKQHRKHFPIFRTCYMHGWTGPSSVYMDCIFTSCLNQCIFIINKTQQSNVQLVLSIWQKFSWKFTCGVFAILVQERMTVCSNRWTSSLEPCSHGVLESKLSTTSLWWK